MVPNKVGNVALTLHTNSDHSVILTGFLVQNPEYTR